MIKKGRNGAIVIHGLLQYKNIYKYVFNIIYFLLHGVLYQANTICFF